MNSSPCWQALPLCGEHRAFRHPVKFLLRPCPSAPLLKRKQSAGLIWNGLLASRTGNPCPGLGMQIWMPVSPVRISSPPAAAGALSGENDSAAREPSPGLRFVLPVFLQSLQRGLGFRVPLFGGLFIPFRGRIHIRLHAPSGFVA